jgi:hypothetical protein
MRREGGLTEPQASRGLLDDEHAIVLRRTYRSPHAAATRFAASISVDFAFFEVVTTPSGSSTDMESLLSDKSVWRSLNPWLR